MGADGDLAASYARGTKGSSATRIFFKAVIIAHLGAGLYEERLAQLAEGSVVEQAGAAVMQPDAVSAMFASKLRPFLR